MHELQVQRTLIAFIKRETPNEWAFLQSELRNEFAELMAGLPSYRARRNLGQIYHQRMAAMVVAMARYLSIHR